MSGAAHTPGPWEAHGSIYDHMVAEVRAVEPGSERGIAQVWAHENGFADARLMASAPELLGALRALESVAKYGGLPIQGELEDARAAIAKATGAA